MKGERRNEDGWVVGGEMYEYVKVGEKGEERLEKGVWLKGENGEMNNK